MTDDHLPVIIGVGQAVDHWDGSDPAAAPHPLDMIRTAISRALDDTGAASLASAIDCAAFLRTFPDSLRKPFSPFGTIKNLPRAVLNETGIAPREVIYSAIGGEQPQALVNELSARLHRGEIGVALIAGGEVTGALKTAVKNKVALDWSDETDGPLEDRTEADPLLSKYEIANGLGMPPQTYAAQEQAWRARKGLSRADYLAHVGRVFSGLSEVAATNPYSQFPQKLDAEFLATPLKHNYPICDPLLKWHVAQDAVNQSAALIVTTAGKARELGIDPAKWVYLHGTADVKDTLVSKRPDLSRSDAIEMALEQALSASGLNADQITHRDIYSCFPIVVMLAAEALGIDPEEAKLTVTGGLPFFGGPGNNYSTHAIASMVETLRADRETYGLILANGGFISKESAAVYSARAPEHWQPQSSAEAQSRIDDRVDIALLDQDCEAEIEAYTVIHGRTGPEKAYIIARNADGRAIAKVDPEDADTLRVLAHIEQATGQTVHIAHRDGRNFVAALT